MGYNEINARLGKYLVLRRGLSHKCSGGGWGRGSRMGLRGDMMFWLSFGYPGRGAGSTGGQDLGVRGGVKYRESIMQRHRDKKEGRKSSLER